MAHRTLLNDKVAEILRQRRAREGYESSEEAKTEKARSSWTELMDSVHLLTDLLNVAPPDVVATRIPHLIENKGRYGFELYYAKVSETYAAPITFKLILFLDGSLKWLHYGNERDLKGDYAALDSRGDVFSLRDVESIQSRHFDAIDRSRTRTSEILRVLDNILKTSSN